MHPISPCLSEHLRYQIVKHWIPQSLVPKLDTCWQRKAQSQLKALQFWLCWGPIILYHHWKSLEWAKNKKVEVFQLSNLLLVHSILLEGTILRSHSPESCLIWFFFFCWAQLFTHHDLLLTYNFTIPPNHRINSLKWACSSSVESYELKAIHSQKPCMPPTYLQDVIHRLWSCCWTFNNTQVASTSFNTFASLVATKGGYCQRVQLACITWFK